MKRDGLSRRLRRLGRDVEYADHVRADAVGVEVWDGCIELAARSRG